MIACMNKRNEEIMELKHTWELLWVWAAQKYCVVVNDMCAAPELTVSTLSITWHTQNPKYQTELRSLILHTIIHMPLHSYCKCLCSVCGDSVLLQSQVVCHLEQIVCHLLKICLIVLALACSQESVLIATGCFQLVIISVKAISL